MLDNPGESWPDQAARMVAEQIAARGVTDPSVLEAMRTVPRHRFVPENERSHAYDDGPLSIGHGQTISQPYIVALMTALAQPTPSSRALEIGTGCGYQTAVLARCTAQVYTIELEAELGTLAALTLTTLGIGNFESRVGDGSSGWPEAAPFDVILVTAAPVDVPRALLNQLADGGRLVIPLGSTSQDLYVYTREEGSIRRDSIIPVRFVPLR